MSIKQIKFKPIHPDPQEVAHLRRKLCELVARMQADYDRYLKPLVEQMSKEERQLVKQGNEIARALIGDAEKYLTPYEVARRLHILKSRVLEDCTYNRVKGAVAVNTDEQYLIPESAVSPYGELIGVLAKQSTVDKFNERLQLLIQKYESLSTTYTSVAEKFTQQMYVNARKKFLKQFPKEVGIDIIKNISEKGLKDAFDLQVAENVNLIKSIPQGYFNKLQDMVTKSVTGGFDYKGGLQKAIADLTGVTRDKAVLIARDQSMKTVSTFTRMRYENLGSEKYIWHNSKDRRVAGNPHGLYPDVNKKSEYHGNHWEREGKVYYWEKHTKPEKGVLNPPPDGSPGMAVNCRCWAEPIFDIEENNL